jgi:hypothetical protein
MNKGKDKILVDFSEVQLREVFSKAGLNSQYIDRAIVDYMRYRKSELSNLSLLSYKDLQNLGADAVTTKIIELRDGVDIMLIAFTFYLKEKKAIAETYQESKNWDKVITTVNYNSQEAFIDYVEETYQTKVKDAKQLQKLTGITEETLEGLKETITRSRYSKYSRALKTALQEGAKYKDLLQIKPQDYGLPKTWSGCSYSDQYSSILWALSLEFLIDEPASLMMLPDLRSIAQEVEAPYSVLMDAHKLLNK